MDAVRQAAEITCPMSKATMADGGTRVTALTATTNTAALALPARIATYYHTVVADVTGIAAGAICGYIIYGDNGVDPANVASPATAGEGTGKGWPVFAGQENHFVVSAKTKSFKFYPNANGVLYDRVSSR